MEHFKIGKLQEFWEMFMYEKQYFARTDMFIIQRETHFCFAGKSMRKR